jgi:hypothetical protein
MRVIGMFHHLRQHPSGGGSYNFLLADNASATPKIGIRFRSREFRILP